MENESNKQVETNDNNSYDLSLVSIDSLINRLKALKTTMKKKKFVISKLTWDDTKILYEKLYTKNIDKFFNNCN